jgi:hypothetical protein
MLSTPSTRPLSSLADNKEECQTLLALAFGYAPPLDTIESFTLFGPLGIRSLTNELILSPDGTILSSRISDGTPFPESFNAYKVVTWLQQSNIEFGGNNPALV